jgi:hypothetical protein
MQETGGGNSRLALVVGFGGLLGIMTLAGIDALRVLHNFYGNDDRIRREFLFQNRVLNEIRSDVYLSGTYVRDYLLEPEAARAENYRIELEQLRKQMDGALASYGSQLASGEAQQYTALRGELADYWEILAPIFRWSPEERRRLGYAFCATRFFRGGRTCSKWPTGLRRSMNSS